MFPSLIPRALTGPVSVQQVFYLCLSLRFQGADCVSLCPGRSLTKCVAITGVQAPPAEPLPLRLPPGDALPLICVCSTVAQEGATRTPRY